jgi:hypothetical protein
VIGRAGDARTVGALYSSDRVAAAAAVAGLLRCCCFLDCLLGEAIASSSSCSSAVSASSSYGSLYPSLLLCFCFLALFLPPRTCAGAAAASSPPSRSVAEAGTGEEGLTSTVASSSNGSSSPSCIQPLGALAAAAACPFRGEALGLLARALVGEREGRRCLRVEGGGVLAGGVGDRERTGGVDGFFGDEAACSSCGASAAIPDAPCVASPSSFTSAAFSSATNACARGPPCMVSFLIFS